MDQKKEFLFLAYDRIMREDGNDLQVDKIRDLVANLYVDAVLSGELRHEEASLHDQARGQFDKYVMPLRKRRSNDLVQNACLIAASLRGDGVLPRDHPVWWSAYPLGNGSDKTLAYFDADDWLGALRERQQVAADSQKQAEVFEPPAFEIIASLRTSGALQTIELAGESGSV